MDFLDHDEALNGLDEFPLGYYPTKTQGDRAFIELLLRSKHFLSHYGFKGTHRTTTVMTMDEIFQKVVVKESRTGRVSRQRFATVAEELLIDVPSSWSPSYDDDPEKYQDGENDVFQEDIPLDLTTLPLPPPQISLHLVNFGSSPPTRTEGLATTILSFSRRYWTG